MDKSKDVMAKNYGTNSTVKKDSTFQGLKNTVLTPLFILYILWYILLHMRVQTFVGGANMWFREIFENDRETGTVL